jgi:tRNA threonylcarbamoyladenosine biosynthesis protein TsaE
MPLKGKITTHSAEETFQAGVHFAQSLQGNEVVAFFGDLGSGKTTFLKGMISTLAKCKPDEITSPTFTYLHIYEGPVFHFDLYRLSSSQQFGEFSAYLQGEGICCIEWAEKIEELLPPQTIRISIQYSGENSRVINII